GIPTEELDDIQKEMIGFNNLLKPYYAPKISIETVDKQNLLVMWVPAGMNRPYEVPENITAKEKKHQYYIRKYASSVQPSKDEREDDNYSYFITTLPIHPIFHPNNEASEGLNEGLNVSQDAENKIKKIYPLIDKGLSEGLSEGLKELIDILMNIQGLNATEISNRMNKGLSTVERYLRKLKKNGIVEFRGSKKTGGYYLK
ncbi:MAG: hypothetical protein ACK5LR_11925, partial [Mangrovibacterium sp.]